MDAQTTEGKTMSALPKPGGRKKKKPPETLTAKCRRLAGACAMLQHERALLEDELLEIRSALGSDNALNAIALLKERHETILRHAGDERVRMSRELNLAIGGVNSWGDMLQRVAELAAASQGWRDLLAAAPEPDGEE